MIEMARAWVTGGAGFIGSYLCEELINQGYEISVIDNLFRGKLENIEHILKGKNYFYQLDIAKVENLDKIVELLIREQPELIFHYAAINGTQYFYDIPSQVLEVNSMATYYLMCAIREAKAKKETFQTKILYASSSEVFGEPFSIPSKETDITYVNVNHIRDSYAVAKLIGEFYVKLIAEEIKIDWIILRLFNVYGPRMVGTKYGQVIPEFIKRLQEGEYPLKLYGNGEHKRSFCYVTDNVEKTVKLAKSNNKNEIYNIGNAEEMSILELGEKIMKKMNLVPEFQFLPEREGDHKRRCPDTTKLQHAIGNDNYIKLEEGLERILENVLSVREL